MLINGKRGTPLNYYFWSFSILIFCICITAPEQNSHFFLFSPRICVGCLHSSVKCLPNKTVNFKYGRTQMVFLFLLMRIMAVYFQTNNYNTKCLMFIYRNVSCNPLLRQYSPEYEYTKKTRMRSELILAWLLLLGKFHL